jgi:hypothetical protein
MSPKKAKVTKTCLRAAFGLRIFWFLLFSHLRIHYSFAAIGIHSASAFPALVKQKEPFDDRIDHPDREVEHAMMHHPVRVNFFLVG